MTAGQRWLYRYSWLLVAATSCLIFIGAMVTSKGVGMAVPDWPLSFGSVNPAGWLSNDPVFWEHGHRLVASVIGLLTIGLMIGTWCTYSGNRVMWYGVTLLFLAPLLLAFDTLMEQGASITGLRLAVGIPIGGLVAGILLAYRDKQALLFAGVVLLVLTLSHFAASFLAGLLTELLLLALAIGTWHKFPSNRLLWFAFWILELVMIQGLMGGLRVTEISTALAAVHGCVAQAFYSLLVVFVILISPHRVASKFDGSTPGYRSLRWASVALFASIFIQLIIGAVMRHYHAGLAMIGFPVPIGGYFPKFDSFAVTVHFIHRNWAIVITLLAIHCLVVALKRFRNEPRITRPVILIASFIVVQILLGGLVVGWARDTFGLRAPITTSLHVLNGAAILASSVYFAVRMRMIGSLAGKQDEFPSTSTVARAV